MDTLTTEEQAKFAAVLKLYFPWIGTEDPQPEFDDCALLMELCANLERGYL